MSWFTDWRVEKHESEVDSAGRTPASTGDLKGVEPLIENKAVATVSHPDISTEPKKPYS